MQRQTIQFAVQTKGNVVQTIGKSLIYQPKTNYDGRKTKWYEDKPKKGGAV